MKKCSVADICRKTGISKMTIGKVIRYLEGEHVIRKYYYRSIHGSGAKATYYYLNPKTSVITADLRHDSMGLCIYSVPRFNLRKISPKIRVTKPISDKARIIKNEAFSMLRKRIPEKYILGAAFLTDEDAFFPDGYPRDEIVGLASPEIPFRNTFVFTSEELEAEEMKRKAPGKTVMYLHFSPQRKETMFMRDGVIISRYRAGTNGDMSARVTDIAEEVVRGCSLMIPDIVHIFTPFPTVMLNREVDEAMKRAGIPDETELEFSDGYRFDVRRAAARKTLSLIAENGRKLCRQRTKYL